MAKYRIPSDYKNDVSQANHNWTTEVGGTIHPGLAYLQHHRHIPAKTRIRGGDFAQLVQSESMKGPLLSGFKLVTIATFTPDSVIYGWMRNGVRYTPDQYQNFSKWYFTAVGDPYSSAAGPAFPDSPAVKGFRLTTGSPEFIEASGSQPDFGAYEIWASDTIMSRLATMNGLPHVGRGGFWDWNGVPAGAVCPRVSSSGSDDLIIPDSFKWNISSVVAYFLSCYYYIANMQEDYMYYSRNLVDISYSNSIYPGVDISLANLPFDRVFASVDPAVFLRFIDKLAYDSWQGSAGDIDSIIKSDSSFSAIGAFLASGLGAHGGLFSVPYSPDLFGNIIKSGTAPTAYIDVEDGAESSTGYSVAVPQLRLQTKIQNMLDRLFVSGGRFGDVLRTLWGVKASPYVNKPDFLGVWQMSVNPSNVVASAAGSADGSTSVPGQMAARVDSYSSFGKTRKVDYYTTEPGTLAIISMLVPDPAYTQGLHPDLPSLSFGDDFNPEMGGIGFQSVPRHRFSMMPTDFLDSNPATNPWFWDGSGNPGVGSAAVDPNQVSVGEEVAWSWLRTDYPRLHGEFAQNGSYQYWVLVRRFTDYYLASPGSDVFSDYSYYGTYINPLSWQYLFDGQSFADPNFILLSRFPLYVTSSVPANYMPYLGK